VTNLPVHLNVAQARLPDRYGWAKAALAECQRVDECKDWADKAAAMASYARQSDDDTLYKTAIRIKSRAIRRCGELLKEYKADPQDNLKQNRGVGEHDPEVVAEGFLRHEIEPTRQHIGVMDDWLDRFLGYLKRAGESVITRN